MRVLNLLFSLFLFISLPASASLPFTIQRFVTSEGLAVAFVHEGSIPMVVMNLGFHAGSGYDAGSDGLAQLVAKCLGEATSVQNGNQIAESLDASGAEFSVQVDPDLSVITMHSQSDAADLNAAVSALIPVISDLNISPDALNRVAERDLQALELSHGQASSIAEDALMQALFADTPYGHSVLGTKDSISAINLDQVMQFYHRYYVDQNGVLILVGDIDFSTARAIANQFSKALPSGQPAPLLVVQPHAPRQTEINIAYPSKQTTILMGEITRPKVDPLNLALETGSTILAGPTMESLLYSSLRQKGLVYSVNSSLNTMNASGFLSIMAQTKNESADMVILEMQEALQGLVNNGPMQSDLENARSFLMGSFQLGYASDENVADLLMGLVAYGYPANYFEKRAQNILLLSSSDITKAFGAVSQSNNGLWVTVKVGGGEGPSESSAK